MAVIKLVGALYQKNLQPEPSKKKSWDMGTPYRDTDRLSQDQHCVF